MGKLSEVRISLDKGQIVHLACWASLIFLEVVVAGLVRQQFSSLPYYILFYILNILLFYFHAGAVMPHANNLKLTRLIKFLLLLFFELLVYLIGAIIAGLILKVVFHEKTTNPFPLNMRYIAVVGYRALFFMVFGTGYYFLKQHIDRREAEMQHALELEKLENKLLTAQKDYLRAQINPHLLFNTLDFIKAVSKKNPDQSDEAIDCLTEIMDYALETSKEDFVDVEREIEQIDHMIRLNLLRSGNRLNLKFNKEILVGSAPIIPIVLLTLVENIFKHGNLLDKNNPAIIELIITGKELSFKSINLIANTPPSKGEHTGLKNIKARLVLSYPENHFFQAVVKENIFHTELKVNYI